MNQIDLNQLRDIQLSILDEIVYFCTKNNIKYYLTGGTLLGSIRHQGFIPWDDDIDIALFRNDYEWLLKYFKSESGKIKLLSYKNYKKYRYLFAKAIHTDTVLIEENNSELKIGVYIDIFPIDFLLDNKEKCVKFLKKIQIFQAILALKYLKYSHQRSIPKNIIVICCNIILLIIPDLFLLNIIDFLNRRYIRNNNSKYIANLCGAWGEREITLRDYYKDSIVVKFEGRQYFAPIGYDGFLTDLYKDYMRLPPVDKQISHHSFKAYWK